MNRIFAFDPGQTTGYCSIDINDEGTNFVLVRCAEIEWEARIPALHGILYEPPMATKVVVESFRLFPHKAMTQIGSQFPSAQMIGSIEAMMYMCGLGTDNIAFQQPGDIRKVMVREEDIEKVSGSPHKIDAYRHARLYFLKHFYMNPFA